MTLILTASQYKFFLMLDYLLWADALGDLGLKGRSPLELARYAIATAHVYGYA